MMNTAHAAAKTTSTDRFVTAAVERLNNEIAYLMRDRGMSREDAIADARSRSIAGPKVWALVEAR